MKPATIFSAMLKAREERDAALSSLYVSDKALRRFTKSTRQYNKFLNRIWLHLNDRQTFEEWFEKWCSRVKDEVLFDHPEDYTDLAREAFEAGRMT